MSCKDKEFPSGIKSTNLHRQEKKNCRVLVSIVFTKLEKTVKRNNTLKNLM